MHIFVQATVTAINGCLNTPAILPGLGRQSDELALKSKDYVCGEEYVMGRWYETTKHAVLDAAGNVSGIVGVIRDITERKKTDMELTANEKRYRSLFQSVGDYALVLEFQQEEMPIIVDANDAAFAKHGYTRQEMIGKPISFLDTELSKNKIGERVEALKKNGIARFEVEHACKDGSTFLAETVTRIVEHQDKSVFYSIERDITERKKAEDALREHTQKLERFNKMAVGRELQMIELKKEINALLVRLGESAKYTIHDPKGRENDQD